MYIRKGNQALVLDIDIFGHCHLRYFEIAIIITLNRHIYYIVIITIILEKIVMRMQNVIIVQYLNSQILNR